MGVPQGQLMVSAEQLCLFLVLSPGLHVKLLASLVKQSGQLQPFSLDGWTVVIISHDELNWFCVQFGNV